ncbi:MAG: mandelate racemase [Gluconacetobacter diazotrophicus]|nr:mandelate racemase [Gluconacetobacter diazotrophicus]
MDQLVPISGVSSRAYTVPTDAPEADGTIAWDSTTMVTVEIEAGGERGFGYTYGAGVAAELVRGTFAPLLEGRPAMDIPVANAALWGAVRNMGRSGIAATAISAVDIALWDLKARLLGLPLATLLGAARDRVRVYGSGGFTSYDDGRLQEQLAGWVGTEGCLAVKMKVGSEPARDPERVRAARRAIGNAMLFVDANGGYGRKQAIKMAELFAAEDVFWFEEPVSSDDRHGLRLVREAVPAPMEVAAGEYGFTLDDSRELLEARSVDVLQADATRCGGVSGFLKAAALAEAHHTDLSGHCGPSAHRHVACAAGRLRNLEWFHDHVRIEQMLFDGAPVARDGVIRPDLSRPGIGIELKRADAERFAAD